MYERDLTLKELWQQTAELESLQLKRRELEARRAALDERLDALDRTRRAEAADVARLEGGSLAAFFYQALDGTGEKLKNIYQRHQRPDQREYPPIFSPKYGKKERGT